jgi:hypothetical protein
VLHFAPVHPQQIKRAYQAAGLTPVARPVFVVDPYQLDPDKTVIYLYRPRGPKTLPPAEDFIAYRPELVEQYSELPQGTLDYYREAAAAGRPILAYHLVPHVLYKGTIDTAGLEVLMT